MSFLIHSMILAFGGICCGISLGILKEGSAEPIGWYGLVIGFIIICLAVFTGVHA